MMTQFLGPIAYNGAAPSGAMGAQREGYGWRRERRQAKNAGMYDPNAQMDGPAPSGATGANRPGMGWRRERRQAKNAGTYDPQAQGGGQPEPMMYAGGWSNPWGAVGGNPMQGGMGFGGMGFGGFGGMPQMGGFPMMGMMPQMGGGWQSGGGMGGMGEAMFRAGARY